MLRCPLAPPRDASLGRRHVETLMKRMGTRGALSPSAHDKARAGPQDLPVSAARGWRSRGQTRCGRWTSPTSRWRVASSHLAVVLDWFSRRVLSWRLSITTMEAAFCVETLGCALARHGRPDIFNTDQGSQFTGQAFTGVLIENDIAISMDGKGAWRDNVFVERLWRSVKYEEVYLRRPPTTSARLVLRSAATSASTTAVGHTRALTTQRPITLTSTRPPIRMAA